MRLAFAFLILLLATRSTAAGSSQAAPAPRSPLQAAGPVDCRDFRNRPVRVVDTPGLGDAGRAEFIDGRPVIMLDPALMATLPASLQVFFNLHECAHHVLGHLFAPTLESEKEADCWGIKEGRKRKAFDGDTILAWKPYFAASLGSKLGHLPGPERIAYLMTCFENP